MICPKCKQRTEVLETAQRDQPITRRRRRCIACYHRFTTIETLVGHEKQSLDLVEAVRVLGRKRKGFDAEAIAAAIAVDRRKAKIAREQREREYNEHAAPRHLSGAVLRRELKGY